MPPQSDFLPLLPIPDRPRPRILPHLNLTSNLSLSLFPSNLPMPTEPEISAFISLLHPLPIHTLPIHSRECPICLDPYFPSNIAFNTAFLPSNEPEYPVRIKSQHPNTKCEHVFGRRCIEKHFRSGGPWSTKCPMCKEEWVGWEGLGSEETGGIWESGDQWAGDADVGNGFIARAMQDSSEFMRIQIPQEIRLRVHTTHEIVPDQNRGQNANGDWSNHLSGNPGEAAQQQVDFGLEAGSGAAGTMQRSDAPDGPGFSSRGRVHRSIGFLERMLLTAEIDDEGADIEQRVEEVERAIERFWRKLEETGRGQDEAARLAGNGRGGRRILRA